MAISNFEKSIVENSNVRAEYRRLLKLYKDAPEKQLNLAKKLLVRAAFMAITLEELEKKIEENGVTEPYQNGANQKGVKKSAEVEVYNTMSKNYAAIMRQHSELLPKEKGGVDGFDDFKCHRE